MARSLTAAPTLLDSVSRLSTSPRRRGERAQQRDLGVGERHALALLRELAQLEVELQGAESHLARRLARPLRRRPVAPQHVLDAQQELAHLERLGEIVVDALLQAGDAVLGLAHGGQHEDRHVVGAAQLAGEVEAGLARHHDVEHDQVEVERGQALAGLGGVPGGGDAKAVARQERLQEFAQARVVVDDQDVRLVGQGVHAHRPPPRTRLSTTARSAGSSRPSRTLRKPSTESAPVSR